MTKAKYVDGFVLVVPKSKKAAYIKLARSAATVAKKFGALDYKECRIDDMQPKGVTFTFAKLIKPKKGEEVWFSYVAYKSRTHRDAVNKKVMAYYQKKYSRKDFSGDMPFDMKRMSHAGFKVEASS